jgi:hypothetical protein
MSTRTTKSPLPASLGDFDLRDRTVVVTSEAGETGVRLAWTATLTAIALSQRARILIAGTDEAGPGAPLD